MKEKENKTRTREREREREREEDGFAAIIWWRCQKQKKMEGYGIGGYLLEEKAVWVENAFLDFLKSFRVDQPQKNAKPCETISYPYTTFLKC